MSGWDFTPEGATPVGQVAPPADASPTDGPPPPPSGGGTATSGASGPDETPAPAPKMTPFNRLLYGTGELLITIGCVLLLFVVYEVWVSNFFAHRHQQKIHNAFVNGPDPLNGQDRLGLPAGKQVILPLGQGIANLYIPRFGKDYAQTIVEGVSDADLELGPGHYPGTAIPGQIGNFAVAGHRVGKGEPFLNLDKLHPGDSVVVQTKSNWYVYKVLGDVNRATAAESNTNSSQRNAEIEAALAVENDQGVPGREIVAPTAIEVVDQVPDHPENKNPTKSYMTMTTCHPKYTANERMVVHALLERSVPVLGDAYPREMAGGTL
jgi:sortase A